MKKTPKQTPPVRNGKTDQSPLSNSSGTPSAAADLPNVETLAHLAAQARFKDEMNPGNAALAALNLWRECKRTLDSQGTLAQADKKTHADKAPPFPKTQPVTLDDFYRCVVKAKNETENQPRFKKFLRFTLGTEQAALRSRRDAAKRNADFFANPDDGKDFRDAVVRLEAQIMADDAMDVEYERRFVERKKNPFTEREWYRLASDYVQWWRIEKHRNHSNASRKRWDRSAAKKRRKKVVPVS
jgi:hypothetical protein